MLAVVRVSAEPGSRLQVLMARDWPTDYRERGISKAYGRAGGLRWKSGACVRLATGGWSVRVDIFVFRGLQQRLHYMTQCVVSLA